MKLFGGLFDAVEISEVHLQQEYLLVQGRIYERLDSGLCFGDRTRSNVDSGVFEKQGL